MSTMNKVFLIGYLGKNADLKYMADGTALVVMSVSTTASWKDKAGERKERVEWHTVSLWGRQAEGLAPYLEKGKHISVEGKLNTRKWKDKTTGADTYRTEVRADRVLLLGKAGTTVPAVADAPEETPMPEDDIPF